MKDVITLYLYTIFPIKKYQDGVKNNFDITTEGLPYSPGSLTHTQILLFETVQI